MLFLSFLSIIASDTIFDCLRHLLFPQLELSRNLGHTLVIIHNMPDQHQQTAQLVWRKLCLCLRGGPHIQISCYEPPTAPGGGIKR